MVAWRAKPFSSILDRASESLFPNTPLNLAGNRAVYITNAAACGLAGDAVVIAPVSGQIPCKQGIFQGISQNPGPEDTPIKRKAGSCSHFFHDSLLKLTGKMFWRTGILDALNRETRIEKQSTLRCEPSSFGDGMLSPIEVVPPEKVLNSS